MQEVSCRVIHIESRGYVSKYFAIAGIAEHKEGEGSGLVLGVAIGTSRILVNVHQEDLPKPCEGQFDMELVRSTEASHLSDNIVAIMVDKTFIKATAVRAPQLTSLSR